jgi:outer membrane lipoprotein SlyB
METNYHLHHTSPTENRDGILYPLMLIAAIAVIIFSVVGIATMTGMLPGSLSTHEQRARESVAKNTQGTAPAPQPATVRESYDGTGAGAKRNP